MVPGFLSNSPYPKILLTFPCMQSLPAFLWRFLCQGNLPEQIIPIAQEPTGGLPYHSQGAK